MTQQAVVYSSRTGRVRYVLDTEDERDPTPLVKLKAGEALHVRQKLPAGQNRLHEWQAEVAAKTGKIPRPLHPAVEAFVRQAAGGKTLTVVPDRYVAVDAAGAIRAVHLCDPSCGDALAGHTLIAHELADERWTYSGGTFSPPVE